MHRKLFWQYTHSKHEADTYLKVLATIPSIIWITEEHDQLFSLLSLLTQFCTLKFQSNVWQVTVTKMNYKNIYSEKFGSHWPLHHYKPSSLTLPWISLLVSSTFFQRFSKQFLIKIQRVANIPQILSAFLCIIYFNSTWPVLMPTYSFSMPNTAFDSLARLLSEEQLRHSRTVNKGRVNGYNRHIINPWALPGMFWQKN